MRIPAGASRFVGVWLTMLGLAIAIAIAPVYSACAEELLLTCAPDGSIERFRLGGAPSVELARNPIGQGRILRETCEQLSSCIGQLRGLTNDRGDVSLVDTASSALRSILEQMREEQTRLETAREDSDELRESLASLRQSLRECGQVTSGQSSAGEYKRLTISYPQAGPNRAKSASNYDRSRIEGIVRASLASGVDPWLALGIALMENPPVAQASSEGYENRYGLLPVDSLAAYDRLGCLAASPKRLGRRTYTTPADAIAYREIKKRESELDATWTRIERDLSDRPDDAKYPTQAVDEHSAETFLRDHCVERASTSGDPELIDLCPKMTRLVEVSRSHRAILDDSKKLLNRAAGGDLSRMLAVQGEFDCDDGCPAFFIPQRRIPVIDVRVDRGPLVESRFCSRDRSIGHGSYPAFRYVSSEPDPSDCCVTLRASASIPHDDLAARLKSALALDLLVRKVSSRVDKPLSSMIQTYNGLGKLGATEKLDSRCYAGLDMSRTPVYGARVADLMVKALMGNSEIQGIVQSVAAEYRQSVSSILCQKHGPGTHRIDADQFLAEQRRYLAGRSGCTHLFR